MRSMLVLVVLQLLAIPALAGGTAQNTGAGQQRMTTYQLVTLRHGPRSALIGGTAEGQQLLKEHVGFLYRQAASGQYAIAGPVLDEGGISGLIVVRAATPAAALAIAAEDPGVKGGLFTSDAAPFMAPEGWFGPWAEFGAFERVFFGFLVSGPDRSQDAATAKRLQAEHLAYMERQAREGKLVMAGPFTTEGTRRGIVVYRAADEEEARSLAEGDPMVKVGRLAVELHPWQVPAGALPKP